MKKYLSLALLAIAALLPVAAPQAAALTTPGSWVIFPALAASKQTVVQTPDRVYVLSGPTLFSVGTDDNETIFYNNQNKLSDTGIQRIKYNPDKKYLLILYSSGNIDLLYDDGHVVNMPDLRDAVLTTQRDVNSVFFGPDNTIVLSTVFGFVVYDDVRHQVRESGLLGANVSNAFIAQDHLMIIIDNVVYASPMDSAHSTLSCFHPLEGLSMVMSDAYLLDNGMILASRKWASVVRLSFIMAENRYVMLNSQFYSESTLQLDSEGNPYSVGPEKVAVFDKESGEITSTIDLPAALANAAVSMPGGVKDVWAYTADGLGNYDISSDTPTVLRQPWLPNAMTNSEIGYLRFSADGTYLYISDMGSSKINPAGIDSTYGEIQNTFVLKDGEFTDVSIENATATTTSPHNVNKQYQDKNFTKRICCGTGALVADPDYPDVYYIASNYDGFYFARGNEEIMHLNLENSPIVNGWCASGFEVKLDHEDNLWLGYPSNEKGKFMVLPADVRRKVGAGEITTAEQLADKWILPEMPDNFRTMKDMKITICRHSDRIFSTSAYWDGGMAILDTKGTPAKEHYDRSTCLTSFTDQGQHVLTPHLIYCSVEDNNGDVWFGTASGLFIIEKNSDPFSADFRVRRPIVPRNDGTPYGDFLLENTSIVAMAVDSSNRKWISVLRDGIYLVSPDGTEILEHFDSSNSPLPDSGVCDVVCDPLGNKVYMGTLNGLLAYNSTSAPAKPDYSEVTAYPNPVRPDYHGWVNITGLRDRSLVKIADSAGNVLFQTVSEGGMVTWDACNADGTRVRSGVYYVFASSNADGTSSGAVAKILVIN